MVEPFGHYAIIGLYDRAAAADKKRQTQND
jgi:hypothetical protein